MDDEWVVVGGSGKAKKGSKKGNSHSAQQPLQAPTARPPAIPVAVAPLPGWDGGCAEGCASQPISRGAKPKRGKHHLLERSTEELAADLKQQVQQCRSDIESSSIFASLQQAFQAGAPHLPFKTHKPPSQSLPQAVVARCSNVSPPEPLLDHSHQQSQQHHHKHQQERPRGEQQTDQQPLHQQQHPHSQELQLEQCQHHQQQHQQQQQQQQQEHEEPEDCAGDGQCATLTHSIADFSAPQRGWHLIKELVIFGLGSMQTSSTSRYQLALASLLATKLLPGLQAPPMAFDPAFTPADVALLHLMGIAVISNNQLCAHRAHVPTLFYLPHLEGRLCDNLLAANSSSVDSASHTSPARSPESSSNIGMPQQRLDSSKMGMPFKCLDSVDSASHRSTAHPPESGSNMSLPPQHLDSVDSASHRSTAHSPEDSTNMGMQTPHVVCTQADGSSVPSSQGTCSSTINAPNLTSSTAVEAASDVISGGCAESCVTQEGSSSAPGGPLGTCTDHHHQHTLHNCVLLANRFSTYEGRAPGPAAGVGGGAERCLGFKQGGKWGKGRKLGGHTVRIQQGNGAPDTTARGSEGGLEALLASGQPATMVSLVSAGAVLEHQVKEDRHFPSPSAFNDMALHIIP